VIFPFPCCKVRIIINTDEVNTHLLVWVQQTVVCFILRIRQVLFFPYNLRNVFNQTSRTLWLKKNSIMIMQIYNLKPRFCMWCRSSFMLLICLNLFKKITHQHFTAQLNSKSTVLKTTYLTHNASHSCWYQSINSFHWYAQNAMIPCHSQKLLPFLSVTFLPPFSTNYFSILSHLILPSISWSTSQSCCSQIHIQYPFGNSTFFHSRYMPKPT